MVAVVRPLIAFPPRPAVIFVAAVVQPPPRHPAPVVVGDAGVEGMRLSQRG